jgi:hypothetical protein
MKMIKKDGTLTKKAIKAGWIFQPNPFNKDETILWNPKVITRTSQQINQFINAKTEVWIIDQSKIKPLF